jgi:hypothetical protein
MIDDVTKLWAQAAFEAGRRCGIYSERGSKMVLQSFDEWWEMVLIEILEDEAHAA